VEAGSEEIRSLFDSGRFAEARRLAERRLHGVDLPKAIDAEVAGGKDPSPISDSVYWLARIQESEGDVVNAEINYQLLVRAHERHGSHTSLRLAQFRQSLGTLYLHQGSRSKARVLLEQSMVTLEGSGAANPPAVARVLSHLATIHADNGDLAAAMTQRARALTLLEAHFGAEHMELVPTLRDLGREYAHNGELRVAEVLLARAAAICEKADASATPHPYFPAVLESLAHVYEATGREQDADHAFNRAWVLTDRIHGPNSRPTGLCILAYANALAARGPEAAQMAKKLFKKALRLFKANSGKQHLDVAMAWHGLAHLHANLCRYDYADRYYRKSLSLYKSAGAGNSPMVLDALECLAGICNMAGQRRRARMYERRAAKLRGREA